jgi:hypothetical protein
MEMSLQLKRLPQAHRRRNFEEQEDFYIMANTKALSHDERKTAKRTARKNAPAKAKRTVPRGSHKRKTKTLSRGSSKR